MPEMTVLTGCRRYVIDVTTPKLPLPPLSAQNRSECSSALTATCAPSAVTSEYARVLSQERPQLPMSQPTPPPNVSPAMPVVETTPPVVAKPCACVAASNSAHVSPGSAVAGGATAATENRLSGDRPITRRASAESAPA